MAGEYEGGIREMKKSLSPRQVYERQITEEDVLGQIRQLLELNGARVHRIVERIPWGKRTSEKGIPDLFGWIMPPNKLEGFPPRHFFIEVKRPGSKLRPAQTAWLESARADGVVCFVADSVEKMVEEFRKYGVEIKGL